MLHHTQYAIKCSPLYLLKKHRCPSCAQPLHRCKRSVVINSGSAEAKNYDFSSGDTFMTGNVKFITYFFHCQACGADYDIPELKKRESSQS